MAHIALVTGGSGYFGALLVAELRQQGTRVRVLDIVDTCDRPPDVEFHRGDIRDSKAVHTACTGVSVVYHTAAQVPLANHRSLIRSVNVEGTRTLLEACTDSGVSKVIHLSSSAVFGVPESNPIRPDTPPAPAEAYGKAKYQGELLCQEATRRGLDVTIIRPRTVLGHGRLGIFSILFDFIADGSDVFVLGGGHNTYQFIHADDLAQACIRAAARPGPAIYNIGAQEFGTMRQALENLCTYAATGSTVRSLPARPAALAMLLTAKLRITPFSPYHWTMYSHSLWFDTAAQTALGWQARYSTDSMLRETYDQYLHDRDAHLPRPASPHRSPVRQGALHLLKRLPRAQAGKES